ncbi:MAG: hypothetical protein HY776_07315 [Actinobacteria bacterium]|nr:hypothetical protein [Actinomycetota bacterium]
MSKVLSLKLKEEIFKETEKIRKSIKIPRNAYINNALDFYNKIHNRNILKKKLQQESKLVTNESLAVLEEFESLIES